MPSLSFTRRRAVRIGAIAAVAALVGAGITYAAVPASNTGRITACYATTGTKAGVLRVIDAQAGKKCATGEKSLTWQANGVRFMKAYSASVTYSAGDVVTSGGGSWVALVSVKGVTPGSNAAKWASFAAKGATGATGAQGASGPQYSRVVSQVSPSLAGNVGNAFTATAVKADGSPIIAFVDTSGALGVASCVDPSCTRGPIVTLGLVGSPTHQTVFPSITIGDDGLAGIAYGDSNAGTLNLVACLDIDCTAIGTPTVVVASGYHSQPDLRGGAVLAFTASGSQGGGVVILGCSKVDCTGPFDSLLNLAPIAQTPDIFTYTQVSSGAPGSGPISAFQRASGTTDAVLAICQDTTCLGQVPKLVTLTAGLAGFSMQLQTGTKSNPIAAYFDAISNTIKLDICADSNCTSRTTKSIPAPLASLDSLDLLLTPDGSPVVAWFENGVMQVYTCDSPACASPTTTKIDRATGLAVSGTLNAYGRPVYAFVDGSNRLRVATVTHAAWSAGATG